MVKGWAFAVAHPVDPPDGSRARGVQRAYSKHTPASAYWDTLDRSRAARPKQLLPLIATIRRSVAVEGRSTPWQHHPIHAVAPQRISLSCCVPLMGAAHSPLPDVAGGGGHNVS